MKSALAVPVIAVGRIQPGDAEVLLAEGDICDFVAMGRQLLADAELWCRGPPRRRRGCREVTYRQGGREQTVPADHVVVATGVHPDVSLADSLRIAGLTVHVVGDTAEVGYIQGAVRSGYLAAKQI